MTERNSLAVLAEEIALAFEPLAEAIASPENFTSFMLELGWDLRELPEPIRDLAAPLQVILDIIESGEVDTSNVLELIDAIESLINSINQITSSPNNLFPSSVDAAEFKAEFPAQLVQFLIIEYLLDNLPRVGSVLKTLGVIRIEQVEATATRLAYESLELNWQDLIKVFDDPFIILKNAYQWGSSGFEPDQVLENIFDMGEAFGVNLRFERLETAMEDFLTKDAIALEDAHSWVLRAPIIEDRVFGTGVELGVGVFMLPKTATEEAGFSVLPYGTGEFQEEIELSDDLVLQVEAAIDLAGGIGVLIRPNKGIQVFVDIISTVDSGVTSLSSGFLAVGIKNQSNTASQLLLLGSEDGSRLQVRRPSVVGRLQLDAQGKTDLYVEGEIEGNLVIAPGQGDGFLQKILPPDGISSKFDFTVGFSYLQGFYFRGSATIEITIPVHESIGPINIESVYLTIKIRDDAKMEIVLAASVGARIGPASASIQRIGIKAALSFPDNGGNLGPIQLDGPSFKPPIGAGLAITADPVVGGGYLEFDPDNERYAGMLQLGFGEIELMAIGLITTRMPDGSPGFSMLLIITAEFDPPITLPYNFNLSGVGGLVGIHRTMLVDVIRQGLKNRTIDSILFPEDPILNAPRIISDLRAVFPPTKGRYVIGPMAILNWGNPPLVRAEIGILIELPSPVRIAILGQLTLELPEGRSQANAADQEDDRILVEIHLDLLGIVDFDKKTFSFDATLYDSRIAKFTLSGDSAMRLSWGDNPNFALSVGGLHPRFRPPPNFPTLKRLQLSLGSGNNPRINLDTYMAVTSNSTQFGARLEVFAKKAGFTLQGYMGFDVLFIFSPFSFTAEIGAGVAVKKGSTVLLTVTLDLTLSGPKPWRACGKATFKVVVKKIKVRFDKTWGSGQPDPLPAIDPWPRLKGALENAGNWGARLPAGSQIAVTLRQPGVAASNGTSAAPSGSGTDSNGSGTNPDVVVVHPMGALEIRQRVLPFNLEMDLYGNAPIAGDTSYSVAELWTGPGEPDDLNRLDIHYGKEQFARAQFESLSDSEKLSLPSFEKFDAAILSSTGEVTSGAAVNYPLEYETEVIDENRVTQKAAEDQPQGVSWDVAQYYLKGGAAQVAAARVTGLQAYAPLGEAKKVILDEEDYKVVRTADLVLETEIRQNDNRLTHAEASRLLRNYLAANPQSKGQLQVVPSYEVVV